MSKSVYIKTLLWMAWALVALACEKEVDNPSPAQEVQTVHYRATVHTGIDTKATVGDDMKYKFEEGDRLYVESADKNLYGFLSLSAAGGAGNNMALFEGDLIYAGETSFPNDNPVINLVLVSKEDELHTITGGKVDAVTSASYLANKWAPSLGEAVSHLSHFTGTGNFNDPKFTLNQQSGFLKCFVRMKSEQAPVDRVLTAKLLNNGQPFREASVRVSEEGAVPFVFAFLGDQVTLENAQLVVEYNNEQLAQFGITGKALAANKYYSISRSTLSFDGFKIKAVEDNTKIWFNYTFDDSGIEYSLDFGETWEEYTNKNTKITLQAKQVLCVRGTRTNYLNVNTSDNWGTPADKPIFRVDNNKLCYISGNIMSLLAYEDHLEESAFQGAFSRGTTQLTYIDIDPEEPLILPIKTLASQCYMRMFHNCISLTKAPQFKVEGTAYRCCYNMFRKCSGLTDVSLIELPAMTLSVDCYRELFRECSNLQTAAPMLPAPTLVKECYRQMFSSSKITSITCLATDISATDCLNEWVSNVPSGGIFYKSPDIEASKYPTGSHGIPSGWTVKDYGEE
jgi:hypothetical protein